MSPVITNILSLEVRCLVDKENGRCDGTVPFIVPVCRSGIERSKPEAAKAGHLAWSNLEFDRLYSVVKPSRG
jgi:hypothetical protein